MSAPTKAEPTFSWLYPPETKKSSLLDEWLYDLHRFLIDGRAGGRAADAIKQGLQERPLPSEHEKYRKFLALCVLAAYRLELDDFCKRYYQTLTGRRLTSVVRATSHWAVQEHIVAYETSISSDTTVMWLKWVWMRTRSRLRKVVDDTLWRQ